MQVIFSEISRTGELSKNPVKESVLASCLGDWANCMAGNTPPENFGIGMLKASQFLGVSCTPESFMELANQLK